MQQVFAPWRFAYVSHAESSAGCIFCAAARGGEETLTMLKGERAFILLNRYPYTSGHLMVAPHLHVSELDDLDAATLTEMMTLAKRAVAALREVYNPHGFNLGVNIGEAAGAGIVDHVHLHVVPRWRGDTNFMSVSSGVRILPEELSQTYAKLKHAVEAPRG